MSYSETHHHSETEVALDLEDQDFRLDLEQTEMETAVENSVPPMSSTQAAFDQEGLSNGLQSSEDVHRDRILNRLLHMADSYRQNDALRQAIELYYELLREHADSSQAKTAEDRLMTIAQEYEDLGELRQARAIYEQLL